MSNLPTPPASIVFKPEIPRTRQQVHAGGQRLFVAKSRLREALANLHQRFIAPVRLEGVQSAALDSTNPMPR